ncbi:MAG TPA: erythromycin esterase family protein, partial [Kofleriaceae bacterium]|nr:erythromycin esterase family protein [Kofleriaceae bacterium]
LRNLEVIRAYNKPLPPGKRIRLIGIDVQNTAAAVKHLDRHVSTEDRARLQSLVANKRDAWKAVPEADRAAIRAALEPIASRRGPGGATTAANRVALVARALLMRIDLLEATTVLQRLDARDAGMARMALEVLEHEKRGRATVWAHLAHVARDQMIGQRTMGAHLGAALGDGYRVYGLHAISGGARAWDTKQEVGVVTNPLRVPPAGSVEAVLGAANGGLPITYWTFADATGDAARWVSGVHAVRQFGAVFPAGERDLWYYDLRSVDGAILFQSVTPTDPMPTGERRAKPKQ